MKAKMYNYYDWIKYEDEKEFVEKCEKMLVQSGFKILNKIEHYFEPMGYTGLFLLAESHLAIRENSNIKSDYGNIEINNTNDIYIDAEVDLGKTKINKNNRNAEIVLKLECDCGNITINN